MSDPYLPPEVLDHIVDFLHASPEALKQCCLASKLLIPRTRKHLFGQIDFRAPADLEAWRKTFQDPATSPARYTHSLIVDCLEVVTAADAEEGGWIRTFTNVVQLKLRGGIMRWRGAEDALVPFHNFSQKLKSLRLRFVPIIPSQRFELICSLPLLEDLTVFHNRCEVSGSMGGSDFRPLTSPAFTGTLELDGVPEHTVRQLLDLPNGLRFRKIMCISCYLEDPQWAMALVERCRDTLESIEIGWLVTRMSSLRALKWNWYLNCIPFALEDSQAPSFDFSNTTKLREVKFRFDATCAYITGSLKTITSKHKDLQRIIIHTPINSPYWDDVPFGRLTQSQRVDLDLNLVQLWELHGVRTKATYGGMIEDKEATCKLLETILPEMTKRGSLELVHLSEFDPS